ncbi:hypothetical protein RCDURKIN_111 [Rhodobacter phage RcDurkin]|nr:hypothetical protein RCDURKIN_111 [Rhodobacter phage RcDurkin]UUV43855.1 hypothetical protein RCKICKAPOO_114 [Rhodobacter phage RcKickapoo]UUV44481.1 hypothetical protein RCMENCHIE_112 [Rhodobacter phage RcMenchie]
MKPYIKAQMHRIPGRFGKPDEVFFRAEYLVEASDVGVRRDHYIQPGYSSHVFRECDVGRVIIVITWPNSAATYWVF